MKTKEIQLASTANSYTIDSKDIDMILDWLIDNRNATNGIVFLGMNANGKKNRLHHRQRKQHRRTDIPNDKKQRRYVRHNTVGNGTIRQRITTD